MTAHEPCVMRTEMFGTEPTASVGVFSGEGLDVGMIDAEREHEPPRSHDCATVLVDSMNSS